MLTRRHFVKLAAMLFGNALVSACAPRLETPDTATPNLRFPTAPPPTPTSTAIPSPIPTAAPTPASAVIPTSIPTAVSTRATSPIPYGTPGVNAFACVRGDRFSYRGVLLPIRGFNYYPRLHPWRTFSMGEWEPRVTERELQLGVSLGANVVRVFVDYSASVDVKTPSPTPSFIPPVQGYVNNIREFLDIAGRMKLLTIVTLFDSMDWAIYQPQNRWIAEEYLKLFVPQFANDSRILCWDLQNEPDRAIRTVGKEIVIPFFQQMSTLIRRLDPNHLLTIGWIDRSPAQFFPDLDDYLDFWCFHFYDKAYRLGDLVQFYKSRTTKPVLLEEFGLPTGGPGPDGQNTELDQAVHYEVVLNTLEANRMCGSAFWCLTDFPVGLAGNPPIKTDSPENHFGLFRLDYGEKPAAATVRNFWRTRPRGQDWRN